MSPIIWIAILGFPFWLGLGEVLAALGVPLCRSFWHEVVLGHKPEFIGTWAYECSCGIVLEVWVGSD
ncbi:hypothetical protein ALVIN_67 [Mycobacterium phage Alvin]|uniref:hypothetical protein n=1 Tax=Mycobacterium phage Alvin TaxID=1567466 RepID=UPI000588DF7D|nr:hypothetical protein ALVIN_67 [Mycobacterium phage Alvin]AJD82571.1 hypothetical protein ALVIN_67 [Mycobacterium phage Alvin]